MTLPPVICLDIESTGTAPATDRIVELGLVRRGVGGLRTTSRWLLNPGCEIPAEASAVHGITDAAVAGAPGFVDVAHEIAAALRGTALVTGYNLRAFDLPILRAEFERAGVAWPLDGVPVVDSYVIFRERERHTLTTAVRRYCGRELVGAHGAVADAEAALDVLEAQLALYPDLAGLSLAELDAASGGRRPDWATDCGRIRWDDAGHAVFAFGKANGQRVSANAGFAGWIMRTDFPADVKDLVGRVLRGERVRAPAPPPPPPPVADDLTFDNIPF